jgi:hypothetical protein
LSSCDFQFLLPASFSFSVYGDLRCGDPLKFNSALNNTCYNSGGVASTKYIVPFYYQYNTVDCPASGVASKQNVTSCVTATAQGTSSDTELILGNCKEFLVVPFFLLMFSFSLFCLVSFPSFFLSSFFLSFFLSFLLSYLLTCFLLSQLRIKNMLVVVVVPYQVNRLPFLLHWLLLLLISLMERWRYNASI